MRSLSRLFSSRQNKTIFVQADPDLPYATVAEVIDMAHQAHVDQVGLITPGMQPAR